MRFSMPGADIEPAGAQWAEQPLVAGEREQVDVVALDVDGVVPERLGGVDEQGDIVFACDAADPAQRLDGAGDVGAVGEGDQARAGGDRASDVVGVDEPGGRVAADACLGDAGGLDQVVEGA